MIVRQLIAYAIIAVAVLMLAAAAVYSRRRKKPRTYERIDLFNDGG